MFAGLSRLQRNYSVFRWHKRLQPLKNRTRGFFLWCVKLKNLSEKTVLRRTGKGSSFLSPWQKTGGGKCWVFVVLTRLKNSFKSHFFYMINELFYCIKNQRAVNLHKFTSSQVHKKSRVDLTGDNRQLEGLYTVHTSLKRFFVSVRFSIWRMVLALARCTEYVQIWG